MKLSTKEQDLIEGLRNFRRSQHNPSWEVEQYLDQIYTELKEYD